MYVPITNRKSQVLIDPCRFQWSWVTLKGGKQGTYFSSRSPYPLTQDQISHGNTRRRGVSRVCMVRYAPILKGGAPASPKYLWPHTCSHGTRNSKTKLLYGDQTRWEENFKNRPRPLPWPKNNIVTRLLTRDSFAVANLRVFLFDFDFIFVDVASRRRTNKSESEQD